MTQGEAIQSAINHSMTLCLALLATEGPGRDIRRKELKTDLRKQLIDCIRTDIRRLQQGSDVERELAKKLIHYCEILNIEVKL